MPVIFADRIVPKYSSAVNVDALSLGGGAPLAAYNRIAYESAVTGPFTSTIDATTGMTGVISRFGEDVTLYMNPYTFTATSVDPGGALLQLSTPIPAIYCPNAGSTTSVLVAKTEVRAEQMVQIGVTAGGYVYFGPLTPSTDSGFISTDGEVQLRGCSISWPITLPA